MTGKGNAAGRWIKYGPIAVAAAHKWGPVVWDQVKAQQEPAEKFMQAKVAKGNQRKKALAHAMTVIDGSVLQVFHAHTAHWVVFSGDDPVAAHPPTGASFDELLDRADLANRVRPRDTAVIIRVRKLRRRTTSTGTATAWVPRDEPPPQQHTSTSPMAPGKGPVVRGELGVETDGPPS